MKCEHHVHVKWPLMFSVWTAVAVQLNAQIPEPPKQRSPEFAVHLEQATNALKKLASDLPSKVAVPKSWDGSIKYYRWTSTSFDRVLMYGHSHGTPDNVPPTDDQPYSAFYYGRDARLCFIVFHNRKAEPYVSDQILYRGQDPLARVTYSAADWSLIDYLHYEKALPVISCRLLRDGSIVLIEEIKPKDKAQEGEK